MLGECVADCMTGAMEIAVKHAVFERWDDKTGRGVHHYEVVRDDGWLVFFFLISLFKSRWTFHRTVKQVHRSNFFVLSTFAQHRLYIAPTRIAHLLLAICTPDENAFATEWGFRKRCSYRIFVSNRFLHFLTPITILLTTCTYSKCCRRF